MVTESSAHRYVRLGLQLGKLDDGVVDAYFGPPELQPDAVAEPKTLVAQADELLAELDDGWLRDQVRGLRTFAGVLAGDPLSYADEVEGCYGVRPEHTDESVFEAAHARLAQLLPGQGTLAERNELWRNSMLVPPDRIQPAIAAVIAEARRQTLALIDLPDGEGTTLEMVSDVPWLGYNFYEGDFRGRVAVNVSMPMTAVDLLILALHETYPGHQAERAAKEQLLVRGQGRIEETIVLAPTPQSVVTEGIGRFAPHWLLAGDGAEALAAIVREAGVEFDLAHALEVEAASEPCRWAEVNTALMLHASGSSTDEARDYLSRWGMLTPELVDHLIR